MAVFDFDGTVIDSNLRKKKSFYKLGQTYGIDQAVVSSALENGGNRYQIIDNIIKKSEYTSLYFDAFIEHFNRTLQKSLEEAPFICGFVDFHRAISIAGVKSVILSATPQSPLDLILERRGLMGLFERAIGTDDKNKWLNRLLEEFSLSANDILMVGDQIVDLEASMYVGCDFLGLKTPGAATFPKVECRLPYDSYISMLNGIEIT